MKGLIIDRPWIDLILTGQKTWEMRSKSWSYRGPLALVRKGSGSVVGLARWTDVLGPFTDDELVRSFDYHRVPLEKFYKNGKPAWRHAWVLADSTPLAVPVPYKHRSGAVITVNLDEDVTEAVLKQVPHLR